MSITRPEGLTENFTILPNQILEDSRLKWSTRAVLCYLLSKPANWNVSVAHLQTQGNMGRDAIYAALAEMIEFGYATKSQKRSKDGRTAGYDYQISWISTANKTPFPDLPDTAEPFTANPTLVSTDKTTRTDKKTNGWGKAPAGVDLVVWEDWSDYKGGSPKKAQISRIANLLAKHPTDVQTQMVDNSIRNGWKGLFELRGDKNAKANGTKLTAGQKAAQRFKDKHGFDLPA